MEKGGSELKIFERMIQRQSVKSILDSDRSKDMCGVVDGELGQIN